MKLKPRKKFSPSEALISLAEAGLSPLRAYEYMSPMRHIWGYGKDPEEACRFLGKNPKLKSLIWC